MTSGRSIAVSMPRLPSLMLAVCLATFSSYGAGASTISYTGSLVDLGSGWRTASVSKAGFASTGGVLGEDGYYLPGAQGVSLMPSYVSSFAPSSSTYPGNGNYASVDNPTTTPGATPTTLTTGTFNPVAGANNQTTVFSFALTGAVPAALQIGLMVDNLDITRYNDYAIQLSSSVSGNGPSVSLTGSLYNDRIPDWIFFDIAGAQAGETISINPTAGSGGTSTLGAIAFDTTTPVPEPTSLAALTVALAALGFWRHRPRRAC